MNIQTILDKHAAWLRDEPGAKRADLRGADLREANLHGTGILAFRFERHEAIALPCGTISIGCERHPIAHWLDHYTAIGTEHGYNQRQIDAYGAWLQLVANIQKGGPNE